MFIKYKFHNPVSETRFIFFLFLFISCPFFGFAHRGSYLAVTDIRISETSDSYIYSFSVQNIKQAPLADVQIEFWINGKSVFQKHYDYIPNTVKIFSEQFVAGKHSLSPQKDKVQIEITRLFGRTADWGGWDSDRIPDSLMQVNTLYSEFYADAPWRMKKTDAAGNLLSIPVHFFFHDADLPLTTPQVDEINIQLKNSSASSFGSILTFNTVQDSVFKSYFSCISPSDTNLDIKSFSLNSFIASSSATFDFNETTGMFDDYVEVRSKYWYFTFNIPSSLLAGMNDEIDILVTIKYANLGWSDNVIGIRVFRTNDAIPSLPGYYRGDTHLHSMYTQNYAELGLPLCATKEAGHLIGLDWITTTDHTSDFDNYGISISSNWARIQAESQQLNNQDTSLIYIAGQELAVNNSKGKIVHFLTYPNPNSPYTFPFLGDGGGDLSSTQVSVSSALNQMDSIGAFGYAAHPFATEDVLAPVVNGGIWNLGHANFPSNGNSFPATGGNIICNDTAAASDVFSLQQGKLLSDALRGAQVWNVRNNLSTSGDALDPWDVDNSGNPFVPNDTASYNDHIKRFRQGLEIVSFINRLGLSLRNQDTSAQNWKFYFSAGADAHGSFNSSNTSDFAGLGNISDNAVGKLSTVVYCPGGMGTNGENVLSALYSGRSALSDGPLLATGISSDGNNAANEIFMGEDAVINNADTSNYYINFDYAVTPEFGEVTGMTFIAGTSAGEQTILLPYSQNSGTQNIRIKLVNLLESVFGTGNIPQMSYFYIRAEMQTFRDLTGQTAVFRNNYSRHHSFTNPIWLRFEGASAVAEAQAIKQFSVFPNPAKGKIFVLINLHSCSEGSISLYNSIGQKTFNETFSGFHIKKEIDVSNYAGGLYLIRVQSGNSVLSRRMAVGR